MAKYQDLLNMNQLALEKDLANESIRRIATNAPELTDFSPGAFHVVIAEAVSHNTAKLMYYAQNMPELVEEYLIRNVFGSSEEPAKSSQTALVFEYSTPAPSGGRTIPAGFIFNSLSGVRFITRQPYTIPSGKYGNEQDDDDNYLYLVPVSSIETGVNTNVSAFSVTNVGQAMPGLVAVTNVSAASGGQSAETYEEMRLRVLRQPLDNLLVTAYDYERYITEYLGGGRIYIITPKLPDETDDPLWEAGKTKIAILRADGLPLVGDPPLLAALIAKNPQGIPEFVSPTITTINVTATVLFDAAMVSSSTLTSSINQTLAGFLRPQTWQYWGQLPNQVYLSELISVIQGVTGVVSVEITSPTGDTDLLIPHGAPVLGTVTLTVQEV